MKKQIISVFSFMAIAFLLMGCLDQLMVRKDQNETILKPSSMSVSPKMDFEKISTVAIMPFFPGGGTDSSSIEDPQFAEQLGSSFVSELSTKQSQWKIIPQKDVLNSIIKNNLGRGYKNFQADYNTASGQMNSFVLTEETKNFLTNLASVLKVDAIIYGSYSLKNEVKMTQSIMGPMQVRVNNCNVSVALYYIKGHEMWWKATSNLYNTNKDNLVNEISKSLSSYVGKGTLVQL